MRQHSDEALQARRVEMEVRLELEKDRSQFLVEPECRIDDHLDRLLFDGEPLDVGDIAAALDRKEEAGWGLIAPGLKARVRGSSRRRVGSPAAGCHPTAPVSIRPRGPSSGADDRAA